MIQCNELNNVPSYEKDKFEESRMGTQKEVKNAVFARVKPIEGSSQWIRHKIDSSNLSFSYDGTLLSSLHFIISYIIYFILHQIIFYCSPLFLSCSLPPPSCLTLLILSIYNFQSNPYSTFNILYIILLYQVWRDGWPYESCCSAATGADCWRKVKLY